MNSTRKWITAAWDMAFVRYLVVGVANTALAYGVYAAALYLGASYPSSA